MLACHVAPLPHSGEEPVTCRSWERPQTVRAHYTHKAGATQGHPAARPPEQTRQVNTKNSQPPGPRLRALGLTPAVPLNLPEACTARPQGAPLGQEGRSRQTGQRQEHDLNEGTRLLWPIFLPAGDRDVALSLHETRPLAQRQPRTQCSRSRRISAR